MKKIIALLAVMAICVSMFAACGSSKPAATEASTAAATEAAGLETAEYTVYNTTGAAVQELYLYNVGSEDKGENLAGEGLADGASVVITREATAEEAAAITYVLEFTAEGMDTQKFETLHFEVAPISLKSVDATSGATPIAFAAPEN